MFHDVGGPEYPLEVFEQQLRYISRHFTVSPLPEALSRLRSGRIIGDEVVLTFDDGLESHATCVYALLERLRLPASFFVCPGLIERGEGIWTLETRARLSLLSRDRMLVWAEEAGVQKAEDINGILAWLKGTPIPRRRQILARLQQFVGSGEGEGSPSVARRLASWEQLSRFDPGLVTIGSQALTHPTLTLLEPPELERELRESQELLEQRLKRPARFFCYPDGAYDARVLEATRRYYDAALTTVEGLVRPGDDLYTLPRIPTAPSLPLLAWRFHRPMA
jgi:peptidoglycan/xylan/chitin deacetylase (PgdA/CDA1 family)